jgi:hypothetical protein
MHRVFLRAPIIEKPFHPALCARRELHLSLSLLHLAAPPAITRAAEFIMQKAFSVYITRKHKVRSASPQKSTSQMSRTRLAQKIF